MAGMCGLQILALDIVSLEDGQKMTPCLHLQEGVLSPRPAPTGGGGTATGGHLVLVCGEKRVSAPPSPLISIEYYGEHQAELC